MLSDPIPCKLSLRPGTPSLQGAGWSFPGYLVDSPLFTPVPSVSHLLGWNAGQIHPGMGVAGVPVTAPSQPLLVTSPFSEIYTTHP